ncbi:hypothetical protein ACET3Z_007652 [Daucus carota]
MGCTSCEVEFRKRKEYQCKDSDIGGVNSSAEEQEAQGVKVLNDDQRLSNQEASQPVVPSTGGGIENLGSNCGSHDEAYLDLEDLFGGDFWPNVDNLLMNDPMSKGDASLNFE